MQEAYELHRLDDIVTVIKREPDIDPVVSGINADSPQLVGAPDRVHEVHRARYGQRSGWHASMSPHTGQ